MRVCRACVVLKKKNVMISVDDLPMSVLLTRPIAGAFREVTLRKFTA